MIINVESTIILWWSLFYPGLHWIWSSTLTLLVWFELRFLLDARLLIYFNYVSDYMLPHQIYICLPQKPFYGSGSTLASVLVNWWFVKTATSLALNNLFSALQTWVWSYSFSSWSLIQMFVWRRPFSVNFSGASVPLPTISKIQFMSSLVLNLIRTMAIK